MKHARACLAVASILIIAPAGAAFAGPAGNPGATLADQLVAWANSLIGVSTQTVVTAGQPNASCEDTPTPNQPGASINAPGSAFNPQGVAGGVYAGQQDVNSKNPKSVSQYDQACAKNQSHK